MLSPRRKDKHQKKWINSGAGKISSLDGVKYEWSKWWRGNKPGRCRCRSDWEGPQALSQESGLHRTGRKEFGRSWARVWRWSLHNKSPDSPRERAARTGEGIKATDFILSLRRITSYEEKWNTAGEISGKREKKCPCSRIPHKSSLIYNGPSHCSL